MTRLTWSVKVIDLYSSHVSGEFGSSLLLRIDSCSTWERLSEVIRKWSQTMIYFYSSCVHWLLIVAIYYLFCKFYSGIKIISTVWIGFELKQLSLEIGKNHNEGDILSKCKRSSLKEKTYVEIRKIYTHMYHICVYMPVFIYVYDLFININGYLYLYIYKY